MTTKRFQKGKAYTLCLVKIVDDEPYTFCVNVVYTGSYKDVREFRCCEHTYTVETKTNRCTEYGEIPVFRSDVLDVPISFDEIDEIVGTVMNINIYYVTNIVPGWQY